MCLETAMATLTRSRETGVRGSGENKIDIMHLKRSTCVNIAVLRACV